MSIILTKGQKIDLTKDNPNLTKIVAGLGWDTNKYHGGYDFDLDASAFLLNENGKANHDEDFIFYNNLKARNDCVIHTGDNRTGQGDGDDETINIDLLKVPSDVNKIAIVITIHEALSRCQNFGQVSNAYIRILDGSTNNELLRFNLGENFSIETAVMVCEIYRYNGEWKFNAVGSGYQGGLASFCKEFGLSV